MKIIPKEFMTLDAGQSIFFARELEKILAKQFDVDYPELKARQFIPVSGEAGPGAESITYEQFDQFGMAKLIADYADDMPRADIEGVKFTSPVESLGISYGYSVQEIRAAAMANRPLREGKARAARKAHEQKADEIAAVGDTSTGLTGFLNNANVPAGSAPTGTWSGATDDLILADMNDAVASVRTQTNEIEAPDTLLLPPSEFTRIAQKRLVDQNTTLLEFFLRTNPWIRNVDEWWRLEDAGAGSTKRMVAYKRDPEKLELHIPQEYEVFPVQERNLELVVPTHSRIGGVLIYKPLSMVYRDGL